MIEKVYEIKIYTDERGREPFTDWVDSLQVVDQARIDARLDRVASGNVGEYKPLGDGVYELKFKNHSGFRIYFGFDGNTIIILLNGGDKDTQNRDIEKAKSYWKDYNRLKVGKNEKL
jgi:putative addiction module killer protein